MQQPDDFFMFLMSKLSERESHIVQARTCKSNGTNPIEIYNISPSRAHQIYTKAIGKICWLTIQHSCNENLLDNQNKVEDILFLSSERKNMVRLISKEHLNRVQFIPGEALHCLDERSQHIVCEMLAGTKDAILADTFKTTPIRVRQIFLKSLLIIGCAMLEHGNLRERPEIHQLIEDVFSAIAGVNNVEFLIYEVHYRWYSHLSGKKSKWGTLIESPLYPQVFLK